MDRRKLIRHTGIGAAAAAVLATPALAQTATAMPELKWRLTSSFPKSLDTIYGAAEFFAKRVAALTQDRFQIRVFAAGEIVPGLQALDSVQNATVECCHTAAYYYVGKDPTFAFDTAVPFGLNTRQHNAWVYQGGGLELMREFYKDYSVTSFLMSHTGAQMGGWYRKEIKTPDDLKGLKMRIGGFAGQVLSKLGVVPQQIAGGDIYPALEKGTIDAAEWVGPYDDQKLGFNKVAPIYHYPGWWEGGPQLDLYVNQKAYDGLSAEYKAIIESAAAYAHTEMQAKYDSRNPAALKQLVASKTRLVAFPKPVLDAAFKEAMALYSEISASNPAFKKIYTDYANFRREANLWFRFTEARFDSYMQSAKL